MSDSEEDFASADEGEVESTLAGTPKVQPEESATAVKKKVKEQEKESNIVGSADKGEVAAKGDKSVYDDTPNQSKKDSKMSEKGMKGPSGRGNGKEITKPKAGAAIKENSADEKSKQKPQSSKSKKGKQKGGKGKTVQSEGDSRSNRKDFDKNTGNKNSVDICEGAAVKVKNEEKIENTDEILKPEANESMNIEKKNENRSEKETENSKDLKLESVKVTATPSDKDIDLESTPKEKKEIVTDSLESLALEQKANMIKSPSSQSITRPEPDHTEKEDAVLNKLAEAANETKGGWGWGWGSSLLEVASSSVSTFTSQVEFRCPWQLKEKL
ncbi:myb-like protein X [Mercenaria mercenaria]|uniref:myb-like protein X n=1 Tax=Mercenaria mercenaria TaxID=6596 RepID=UPI00234E9051|nr:myb-like protein X [Mercenaria mercenaria]